MENDYIYFLKENMGLIDFLKSENERIYERLDDVISSLNHLVKKDNVDADEEIIFDEGYAYFYDRINTIKDILNNIFKGEDTLFTKYQSVIFYYLYLDDIHDLFVREEMDLSIYEEKLQPLQDELHSIMINRSEFNDDLFDKINLCLDGTIPAKDNMITLPEIFTRVKEELMIEAGQEGVPYKD